MTRQFYITGDTHGHNYERITENLKPEDMITSAVIILGDAGFNFYLNKTDKKEKQRCNELGCLIYCVRGNHEERPENIEGMIWEYDDLVLNYVYLQKEFPNIRYLADGEIYTFGYDEKYIYGKYHAFVIGGAYSIDKEYRLKNGGAWFKNEQLSLDERKKITNLVTNCSFPSVDLVLTHTCPRSWEPTELFLPFIDQSKVDKTMENWLDIIKDLFNWRFWFFGHFHDTKKIRPNVYMLYKCFVKLDDIITER